GLALLLIPGGEVAAAAERGVVTAAEREVLPEAAVSGIKVLRDAEGATPEQLANSVGGTTAGSRQGQAQARQELIERAEGEYKCWRCGQHSSNPANMHLGHRNVPVSKGGNLHPDNICLEGAACNLSAGARGAPRPGMSCRERGSCGAPYGRND